LFKFLQKTNTQLNALVLYIRDLNKVIRVFATKTQRETISQIVILLSEIMYIEKIRINYFECLKINKQKTINKINKLRAIIDVITRIVAIQYKRNIANKDIYAIEKNAISTRTTLKKINAKIIKYTQLEKQVNTLI